MDIIESREAWLKRLYIVRLWRVLFCSHPFHKSTKVGTILDPTRQGEVRGHNFVAHVRRCHVCRKYYLDAGFESHKEW